MPRFAALPALGRAPLCAQCARAARRSTAPKAAAAAAAERPPTFTSTSRAMTTARRSFASAQARTSLQQSRWLSLSPRLSAAARGPPATDPDAASSSSPSAASPSTPPSFYALFPKTFPRGAPPAGPFAVDVRALRTEFLRLQAAAHPDFHHAAGGAADTSVSGAADAADASDTSETRTQTGTQSGTGHSSARARAEALSSLINEAYRTLASPLLRAQYLLRQRFDVDLANDESTLTGDRGNGSGSGSGSGGGKDMDLLMAVLEVREEIEQAQAEADLEPVRAANDARMRASEAVLAAAFAADDAAAAQREAVRLRYWVNIDDALRNWERGKDIVLEH
ncbi:Co-chaperone Hsc20 [Sporothrix brasiliensis 5110]|uniref:Co-chaperone Hsc20 n=1 Tax=Sporothrix brasiliensis 5110 TaxID=1398154 RepID=A0A0C2IS93_9PEZI|nr:Co-chaperone Hsc20 [Sporothrix brasiliensis 5110]KIH89720.1 Co-chaperone Hsc20 [Sporothrix brasiliensis 5110]